MASASIWKTVGIGRVGANMAVGAKEVDIIPLEWLPMSDGEMNSNPKPLSMKATDSQGVEQQQTLNTDMKITATWLPSATNRLTAPNVRRGERVEILRSGDADKFYWRSMGLDDHLRKLETIVVGISATTNENDKELNPSNMYWFELSSHKKVFVFSTSKANGEPYQYTTFYNMKDGEVATMDDIGNFFHLVSKLHLIHLQNSDGTHAKLDKKNLKLYAPEDIKADAGRDVSITAGRNFEVTAGAKASINVGASTLTLLPGLTTLKTPIFQGST